MQKEAINCRLFFLYCQPYQSVILTLKLFMTVKPKEEFMLSFENFKLYVGGNLKDYVAHETVATLFKESEIYKKSLEQFYNLYKDMDEIEFVMNLFGEYANYNMGVKRNGSVVEIRLKDQPDKDILLKNSYIKFISHENYRKYFMKCPAFHFLDVVAIYYYLMDNGEEEIELIWTLENLNALDISAEELKDAAYENTMNQNVILAPINEFIDKGDLNSKAGPDLYVFSNDKLNNGSSLLLYHNILNGIADDLGENFFVIPMCIHGSLIVEESLVNCPYELLVMFDEVHNDQLKLKMLESEEVLSNNIYYYNRELEVLELLSLSQYFKEEI